MKSAPGEEEKIRKWKKRKVYTSSPVSKSTSIVPSIIVTHNLNRNLLSRHFNKPTVVNRYWGPKPRDRTRDKTWRAAIIFNRGGRDIGRAEPPALNLLGWTLGGVKDVAGPAVAATDATADTANTIIVAISAMHLPC